MAGDHIEITDGVFTEFTTVQNLTGRLNNNTEHLSGEAQNGPLLVEHYDFQREDGYWYYSCHETNATGGAYDLNLSSTPVGAQDDADVYSIGPDGHFTFLYAHAFEIHAYLDEGGGDVTGYTLSPNLPVNLSLWSGGTLLESGSTTSGDSGSIITGTPLSP